MGVKVISIRQPHDSSMLSIWGKFSSIRLRSNDCETQLLCILFSDRPFYWEKLKLAQGIWHAGGLCRIQKWVEFWGP